MATPTWFAVENGVLLVMTGDDTGKAKRLRRDPSVLVSSCDVRGRSTGMQHRATARLLGAAETEHVVRLTRKRYGLPVRLAGIQRRIRGRGDPVGIEITRCERGTR